MHTADTRRSNVSYGLNKKVRKQRGRNVAPDSPPASVRSGDPREEIADALMSHFDSR